MRRYMQVTHQFDLSIKAQIKLMRCRQEMLLKLLGRDDKCLIDKWYRNQCPALSI